MEFNIGDRVIINDAGYFYNYTTPGSTGVILERLEDAWDETDLEISYRVRFDLIAGVSHPVPCTFIIDPECLSLQEGYVPLASLTQKEKIIRKIQAMQKKRKELGYAF